MSDTTSPIRMFLNSGHGLSDMQGIYAPSATDLDYMKEGRKPCGKVTLLATGRVTALNGETYKAPLVLIRRDKHRPIIEDGCSMLRHLSPEQLEAQRVQYERGRAALVGVKL